MEMEQFIEMNIYSMVPSLVVTTDLIATWEVRLSAVQEFILRQGVPDLIA